MVQVRESTIAAIEADNVVAAARNAALGPIYSIVEFDKDDYNVLFVTEETRAMYESDEMMEKHFGRIHDYVNLDFMEVEMFTNDLLPIANEVYYKTTALDVMKMVRFYFGDRGLFVALDPDEEVQPIADALHNYLWN